MLVFQRGTNVLVHGASGGVGLAAVQMAAHSGAIVVGTAGTAEGLEIVRKNGATEVFNHRASGYAVEIKEKFPNGLDLILEMAAHQNLRTDLDLLARNGKVAVIGSRGEIMIDPRALMTKESSVFGVTLANSTDADLMTSSAFISEFLASSKYRPVINRTYPLSEIEKAHRDVMAGAGARGKLILSIDDQ
ncbi:unnamed protein product [Cylicostephanus goldi]|uniref:Enoyl reductase (ER) domain-containing protein n=1 Tax=Cylicostephanus goldi TaxID=71465 RepID=A0A3P7MB98_CYLGO|nr:unnamed protein product [Cylicostephanus goldi]